MSRTVVIGAGAVGGMLAAQLHLAGRETVLVARGESAARIAEQGLVVRRPHRVDAVWVPVVDRRHALPLRRDDVLVVATKAQDVEAVVADWAWRPVDGGLSAAQLPIVTLSTGLAAEHTALRRFRTVIGGCVAAAASHLVPGEVALPSYPVVAQLWLGEYSSTGASGVIGSLAGDLRASGFAVRVTDDIRGRKAGKLLASLATALQPFAGDAPERARAQELLAEEARAAFVAARIAVSPADPDEVQLTVADIPGHRAGRAPLWQSLERGARVEVDQLVGEVVLLGREHGVPTPFSERVQRILGVQSRRGDPPGSHALAELFAAPVGGRR